VDRAEFGTHLDVVNMITSPRRYFFNDEFLRECFEKLHGTIVSCHLKDILLKPEYTFQLQECACGEGTLDINLYAQLATTENPRMPMIIEHLTTDEEYVASVQYVRDRLYNQ
jgi:L-ribulose-5-phosphate 3-epimerase UlaE